MNTTFNTRFSQQSKHTVANRWYGKFLRLTRRGRIVINRWKPVLDRTTNTWRFLITGEAKLTRQASSEFWACVKLPDGAGACKRLADASVRSALESRINERVVIDTAKRNRIVYVAKWYFADGLPFGSPDPE